MKYGSKIKELRAQGLSYRQIEAQLGCSRALISYHCSGTALPARQTPQIVLSEDQSGWMQLLLGQGVRKADIADALSIPLKEVYRQAQKTPATYAPQTSYERVKRRRQHLKLLAVAYKGGKCEECSYARCYQALDFHHIDPKTKEFTIAAITNRSWSNLKAEVSKCRLLCANCHREHHAKQSGWLGGI